MKKRPFHSSFVPIYFSPDSNTTFFEWMLYYKISALKQANFLNEILRMAETYGGFTVIWEKPYSACVCYLQLFTASKKANGIAGNVGVHIRAFACGGRFFICSALIPRYPLQFRWLAQQALAFHWE